MGNFTNYLENKWLGHIFEGTAFSPPATVALALHTGDPGETGASNECSETANNYARKSCKAQFATAAASRIISNDGDIVFNQATGSWGIVTHWSLWDTSTYGGGNCLAYGSFSAGKAVGSGQTPKVLIGEIDISIPASNGMTTYLANEMLDHTFLTGDGGYTQPTLYFALGLTSGAAFGDGGSWTGEVSTSGTAYARIASAWTVSGSTVTNNGALTFAVATASFGTVDQWAIADGDTEGAGNMLIYSSVSGQAIAADDQVNFPDGELDITFD